MKRILSLVIAVSTLSATPGPALAAARAGEAVVVSEPGPSGRALVRGGSATDFSFHLPDGASCPGDSRNDGYRVQSFLVPEADDPGGLRYRSVAPQGEGRYSLYDSQSRSYVNAQTANAEHPGGPGLIFDLPTFDFAVFPVGELTPGRYRVGIACTLQNETVRYWDTSLDIANTPDDRPAHLTWRVASKATGADVATESRRNPRAVVVAAAVLVAALGLALSQRRRRPTKEPR